MGCNMLYITSFILHDSTTYSAKGSTRLSERLVGEALCEEGVVGGVSDVLHQVGDGALAGDEGLGGEADHGDHGEASVLHLLRLVLYHL